MGDRWMDRPTMKILLCATALLVSPLMLPAQEKPDTPAAAGSVAGDNTSEPEPEMDPATKALIEKVKKFEYKTGTVRLQADRATLNLPEGYRFLGPKDGKTVIEGIWGNPPGSGSDIEGMILPPEQNVFSEDSWAIVVQFEDDGYVPDSDADDIDYDDLLKEMKVASKAASKQRVAAGYGKMELTGWALPPHYDKEKKVLYWAKEFATDHTENSLNYDVRVLGRRGVLSLNAIAGASQKQTIDALTPEIVSLVTFNSGHTYADYNSATDKKADYTMAGLVVGGAVAAKVLAKGGILVLLAKFGKLLIIPVVFIGAWLKRKFSNA
jgi:uncharacterized membrane-anchored protein